jgi:hypothetical protein
MYFDTYNYNSIDDQSTLGTPRHSSQENAVLITALAGDDASHWLVLGADLVRRFFADHSSSLMHTTCEIVLRTSQGLGTKTALWALLAWLCLTRGPLRQA